MKQFIRYLYEYENGEKVRNVGFVKVESDEEKCVVHIHGKGLQLKSQTDMELYVFYKDQDECVGIWQGEIRNVNPALNYRLEFCPEDVGGEETFGQIQGVILSNFSRPRYAAVWDNIPVNIEKMVREEHRANFIKPSAKKEKTVADSDSADLSSPIAEKEESEVSSKASEIRGSSGSKSENMHNQKVVPIEELRENLKEPRREELRREEPRREEPRREELRQEEPRREELRQEEPRREEPRREEPRREELRQEEPRREELRQEEPRREEPRREELRQEELWREELRREELRREELRREDPAPIERRSEIDGAWHWEANAEMQPGETAEKAGQNSLEATTDRAREEHRQGLAGGTREESIEMLSEESIENSVEECCEDPAQWLRGIPREEPPGEPQENHKEEMPDRPAAEPAGSIGTPWMMQQEVSAEAHDTKKEKSEYNYRKITREQIAELPRREWRLANNSFLLHGYHNYHHLLLVNDGQYIFLGIPGVFHEREKVAAEAFGFGNFMPCPDDGIELREEERERENFGYWYRQVARSQV